MSERALPWHILAEIGSPAREARLAAVDQLTRLVYGADLAMAAAARRALERLTEDDSRGVAAAAAVALERTAVRLNPDRVDLGRIPPDAPPAAADVLVDGPPLALAGAALTVSGPGLRAELAGRRLRIEWQPRSDWLDGSVTVRGPAGWADVRVTGQVAAGPVPGAAVEEWLGTVDDYGDPRATRVTVVSSPPRRRRTGTALAVAGVVTLVLLGGVGVAVALGSDGRLGRPRVAAEPVVPPTPAPATTAAAVAADPAPSASAAVPPARRVASVDTPAVVGRIRVGAEPEGVAVAPDGRTIYVANQDSDVVSVVDAASRRVTSVRLRNTPRFVTTSRDGRLVYVSMYEDDKSGSGVAVVNAASRRVVRYLATGEQPYTLAVGPDDRLWVPIHGQGRVEMYDVGDQRPAARVVVPRNPHAVAFSADLHRAFTADHESSAVSVIDMRTDRVLRSIPVSRAPHSLAVSPDGTTVLVAGYEGNTAHLIDARTLRHTGPLRVGERPQSVAFATDGRHAYVVDEGDDTVTVLDARTGAVTATVRVGRSPRTIAVAPDGELAYVSNGDDDTISVLRVGR